MRTFPTRRKGLKPPLFIGGGQRSQGIPVVSPNGTLESLPIADFIALLGLQTQLYMPVTVGGLALTSGDHVLVNVPWNEPLT